MLPYLMKFPEIAEASQNIHILAASPILQRRFGERRSAAMSMPRLSYGPLGLSGRLHNCPLPHPGLSHRQNAADEFQLRRPPTTKPGWISRVACVDETSITVRGVYVQVRFSRTWLIPGVAELNKPQTHLVFVNGKVA